MALATYTDLLASVAAWLNRSDLTAVIPDFVSLAEGRIARDLRLRKQVINTTLSTVAGTQSVTLPSDFLEAENLAISNTSPAGALSVAGASGDLPQALSSAAALTRTRTLTSARMANSLNR